MQYSAQPKPPLAILYWLDVWLVHVWGFHILSQDMYANTETGSFVHYTSWKHMKLMHTLLIFSLQFLQRKPSEIPVWKNLRHVEVLLSLLNACYEADLCGSEGLGKMMNLIALQQRLLVWRQACLFRPRTLHVIHEYITVVEIRHTYYLHTWNSKKVKVNILNAAICFLIDKILF